MGRIVWTDPAIEDLAEIVDYIAGPARTLGYLGKMGRVALW
jgi:plasmid stabilization system protein ParE